MKSLSPFKTHLFIIIIFPTSHSYDAVVVQTCALIRWVPASSGGAAGYGAVVCATTAHEDQQLQAHIHVGRRAKPLLLQATAATSTRDILAEAIPFGE